MFCRKCGKALLEGDRFCCYCGAQVIERRDSLISREPEEDIIFRGNAMEPALKTEPPKVDVGAPEKSIAATWQEMEEHDKKEIRKHIIEPKWDVSGIPAYDEEPKKTKAIMVDWEKVEIITPKEPEDLDEPKEPELPEDLEEVTATEPERVSEQELEEAEAESHVEEQEEISKETLVFSREETVKLSDEISGLEKEILRDIQLKKESVSSEVESQIDRFYTFSQKNAEFQKLLDKEYERLESQEIPLVRAGKTKEADIESSEETAEISEIKEERNENAKPEAQDRGEEIREFFSEKTEEIKEEEKREQEDDKVEEEANPLDWDKQAPPLEDEKNSGKEGLAFTIGGVLILAGVAVGLAAMVICNFFPGSRAAEFIIGVGDMLEQWLNNLIR